MSNATMMAVATNLGAASGSAAGRQVSIRVLEVVSRGGEVLREVVQAVVEGYRDQADRVKDIFPSNRRSVLRGQKSPHHAFSQL